MKFHQIIVPLALVITPGIVLAQQGRDRHPDRDARRPDAGVPQIIVQPQQAQQPRHHDQDRVREEAGRVDPRYVQPNSPDRVRGERADRSYRTYQTNPRLSHGDMTRSLRADERANDVEAHSYTTKHHKKHHKH